MLITCCFSYLLRVVALVDDLLDSHMLPFKQAPAAAVASKFVKNKNNGTAQPGGTECFV
jgi:hypothetical protein